MKRWDEVSHRYTRYCVIHSTLSTICCQKFFVNCSPFVFTERFRPLFDFFLDYVIRRFSASGSRYSRYIYQRTAYRRAIWPCDVFRYIWYIPSWAWILLVWGAKIRTENDGRDRSGSSGICWQVTRSRTWWDIQASVSPVCLSWCARDPRWWDRHIRPYPCALSWSFGFWLWSAGTWIQDPWAISRYRDRENGRTWDWEVEE